MKVEEGKYYVSNGITFKVIQQCYTKADGGNIFVYGNQTDGLDCRKAKKSEIAEFDATYKPPDTKRLLKESEMRFNRMVEMKPYLMYIRDYSKLLYAEEVEYQNELEDVRKGAIEHMKQL